MSEKSQQPENMLQTILSHVNSVDTENLLDSITDDATLAQLAITKEDNSFTNAVNWQRIIANPNSGPKTVTAILTSDQYKQMFDPHKQMIADRLIETPHIPAQTLAQHLPQTHLKKLIETRRINETLSLELTQKIVSQKTGDQKELLAAIITNCPTNLSIQHIVNQPPKLWAGLLAWAQLGPVGLNEKTVKIMCQTATDKNQPSLAAAVLANTTSDEITQQILQHWKNPDAGPDAYRKLAQGLVKRKKFIVNHWTDLYQQNLQLPEYDLRSCQTLLLVYLSTLQTLSTDELQQILQTIQPSENASMREKNFVSTIPPLLLEQFCNRITSGTAASTTYISKLAKENNINITISSPKTTLGSVKKTQKPATIQIRQ